MVAKVLLRILLGPVVLALKLLNLFLAFVMAVSSTVLGIVSALFGLLAVLACFALSWQNGLGLLVVAWLSLTDLKWAVCNEAGCPFFCWEEK